jgi:hypothetical protein
MGTVDNRGCGRRFAFVANTAAAAGLLAMAALAVRKKSRRSRQWRSTLNDTFENNVPRVPRIARSRPSTRAITDGGVAGHGSVICWAALVFTPDSIDYIGMASFSTR